MYRYTALLLALVFALTMLCACSRGGKQGTEPEESGITVLISDVPEPVITAVPEETSAAPTEAAPTEALQTEAAPTQASPTEAQQTSAPTAAPTQPPAQTPQPGSVDYSIFADCAFVGNSVFDGLYRYAIITNSHFFTKTGLNINTVYTATTSNGSVPIINELNSGSYRAVLLMFGQNECGWPSLSTFMSKYEQLLGDIWARQPGCKIFITGLPPITKAASETGTNGLTNENITRVNEGLKQIADRTPNAYFLTVPQVMIGADGALPEAASGGDGIHLNATYYKYWADHICSFVGNILG